MFNRCLASANIFLFVALWFDNMSLLLGHFVWSSREMENVTEKTAKRRKRKRVMEMPIKEEKHKTF